MSKAGFRCFGLRRGEREGITEWARILGLPPHPPQWFRSDRCQAWSSLGDPPQRRPDCSPPLGLTSPSPRPLLDSEWNVQPVGQDGVRTRSQRALVQAASLPPTKGGGAPKGQVLLLGTGDEPRCPFGGFRSCHLKDQPGWGDFLKSPRWGGIRGQWEQARQLW